MNDPYQHFNDEECLELIANYQNKIKNNHHDKVKNPLCISKNIKEGVKICTHHLAEQKHLE